MEKKHWLDFASGNMILIALAVLSLGLAIAYVGYFLFLR